MAPKKWKSVVVPLETYKILKRMAKKEHRTISGQLSLVVKNLVKEEAAKK